MILATVSMECNLMPLVQTPTDVTWKLMAAALPEHEGNICEVTGRFALNVLEAYVLWRRKDIMTEEAAKWYNKPWLLGYLTPDMIDGIEEEQAIYSLCLDLLQREIVHCRKNESRLEVWTVWDGRRVSSLL